MHIKVDQWGCYEVYIPLMPEHCLKIIERLKGPNFIPWDHDPGMWYNFMTSNPVTHRPGPNIALVVGGDEIGLYVLGETRGDKLDHTAPPEFGLDETLEVACLVRSLI